MARSLAFDLRFLRNRAVTLIAQRFFFTYGKAVTAVRKLENIER